MSTESVGSREHRDGSTSRRYPLSTVCRDCGVTTAMDGPGNVRPHSRKARRAVKHGHGMNPYRCTSRARRRAVPA